MRHHSPGHEGKPVSDTDAQVEEWFAGCVFALSVCAGDSKPVGNSNKL